MKHQLRVINFRKAWFSRADLSMKDGTVIPKETRKLARRIMRHVMSWHRRPNLVRISVRLDHRAGEISRPVTATQNGKVSRWINLSTLQKGSKVKIPLLTNPYHEQRIGRVSTGIQINERDGRLTFGLTTLFAISEGQLLGQNWLKQLKKYDALISMIAASQQRAGKKPRDSKRYRALVQDVRGFLTTEINRIPNRLVAQNRTSELILEKLDFRHSDLSKGLNRILRNSGRSIITAKLQDLEDGYGVKHTEVNPAYTSQTCSSFGYVDKRNRTNQSHFQCRWCGSKKHADLNAATNVRTRRARPHGWLFQGKAKVLVALGTEFNERQVGATCPRRSGSKGAPPTRV